MKGAREQRRRQETRGLHYKPPSSRLAATREEATFGDVKGARLESILGCIRNYVVNKIARRVTVSVTKTRRISRQDVYQDISQYIKTSHMSRHLTATRRISRHLTRGISRHLTNRGISIHLTVYQDISQEAYQDISQTNNHEDKHIQFHTLLQPPTLSGLAPHIDRRRAASFVCTRFVFLVDLSVLGRSEGWRSKTVAGEGHKAPEGRDE